ncbi:unnamed protein product [Didymodactylos carnosus]|uniref:Calx-beta domain-containing protein n=2 Tax=Didymodactylos carnosus TaxID=1234261 RepID=A0A8S2DPS6_9BILA|nr:unnamed protein product [Didymodactylos carnosus]CAF3718676.1 unnamed protein product [Didymodactylos carnosus]
MFDWFEFILENEEEKKRRFVIEWSMTVFTKSHMNVTNIETKIHIPVIKIGSLKQSSMITCRTRSNIISSDLDTFNYLYNERLIFDVGESIKICTIILNLHMKNKMSAFYVDLVDWNYTMSNNKPIEINFVQNDLVVEFDDDMIYITDEMKLLSIPIIVHRHHHPSDHSQAEAIFYCYTEQQYTGNSLVSPIRSPAILVRVSLNSTNEQHFGFCNIDLRKNNFYSKITQSFLVRLSTYSDNIRIGRKGTTFVVFNIPQNMSNRFECQTIIKNVNSDIGFVQIQINRMMTNISKSLAIKCTTIRSRKAKPFIDYTPISRNIRFNSNEQIQTCTIPIIHRNHHSTRSFDVLLYDSSNDCSLINPDRVVINIIDRFININQSIIEFGKVKPIIVKENSSMVFVPIQRKGNVFVQSSVICFTKSATATQNQDYIGRPLNNSSRIHFQIGEQMKLCRIELINDQIAESMEYFQVLLADANSAILGRYKKTIVQIENDNDDLTTFELKYNNNSCIQAPTIIDTVTKATVRIERKGDLKRSVELFVQTKDGTALAAIDYIPINKYLIFKPNIKLINVDIDIIYNLNRTKDQKLFNFIIQIQSVEICIDNMENDDRVKKSDYISDAYHLQLNKNMIYNEQFEILPIIMLLDDKKNSHQQILTYGQPLMCVSACNPRHPSYKFIRFFCVHSKSEILSYQWELSMPHENYDTHSLFRRLSKHKMFSTNTSILNTFYFGPKYRIRCLIYTDKYSIPLQSSIITIDDTILQCPPPHIRSSLIFVTLPGQFETFVQLSVEIPHIHGTYPMLALTSTIDFNNRSYLNTQQHCKKPIPSSSIVNVTCKWNFQALFTLDDLINNCHTRILISKNKSYSIELPFYYQYVGINSTTSLQRYTLRIPLKYKTLSTSKYSIKQFQLSNIHIDSNGVLHYFITINLTKPFELLQYKLQPQLLSSNRTLSFIVQLLPNTTTWHIQSNEINFDYSGFYLFELCSSDKCIQYPIQFQLETISPLFNSASSIGTSFILTLPFPVTLSIPFNILNLQINEYSSQDEIVGILLWNTTLLDKKYMKLKIYEINLCQILKRVECDYNNRLIIQQFYNYSLTLNTDLIYDTLKLNTLLLGNNYGRWYILVKFTLINLKTLTSINGTNIQSFYLKDTTIQIPPSILSSHDDNNNGKIILKQSNYRLIKIWLIILLILILSIFLSFIIYHRERRRIKSEKHKKNCKTKKQYDFSSSDEDNNGKNVHDAMIEKFQTGDLTTKVILLNYRAKIPLMEAGTDV